MITMQITRKISLKTLTRKIYKIIKGNTNLKLHGSPGRAIEIILQENKVFAKETDIEKALNILLQEGKIQLDAVPCLVIKPTENKINKLAPSEELSNKIFAKLNQCSWPFDTLTKEIEATILVDWLNWAAVSNKYVVKINTVTHYDIYIWVGQKECNEIEILENDDFKEII